MSNPPSTNPLQAPIDGLLSAIKHIASQSLDREAVIALIKEHAPQAAPAPAPHVLTLPDPHVLTLTLPPTAHPLTAKVALLCAAGLNVALVGPAGCGKTHLARSLATARGVPCGILSCSAGAQESWIFGRAAPNQDGANVWTPSEFATNYARPSVQVLDEIDACDPNFGVALNAALANGHLYCPPAARSITRDVGCWIIAGANTPFGSGSHETQTYTGRARQDASLADRWYMIQLGYDDAYERSIAGMPASSPDAAQAPWKPSTPCATDAAVIYQTVRDWRSAAAAAKLRRVIGTRSMQRAITACAVGVPVREALEDLLIGWTDDERAKIGARS